MEVYVVQFEDGSYWKGQGGKTTKELRSASFLRKCDVENENLAHIIRIAKRYHGLCEPKILKVTIEVVANG